MANSLEWWVRELSADHLSWCYYDTRQLIGLHNELHEQFGDDPSDAIIPGEQRLSELLRGWGLEHRFEDELSKQAGTLVENMAPPTINEVRAYLEREITLLSGAVSLVQTADEENATIYLKIEDGVFGEATGKSVFKMINRWLPSSLQLKAMPKVDKGEFATVVPTHALELAPRYAPRQVELWSNLTKRMRESAAEASTVFKRDTNPRVTVDVIKVDTSVTACIDGHDDWIFVLGEVLRPGVPDKTSQNPDGSDTGADADVVSEVEIAKACHWFARNSQQFEYMHEASGGYALDSEEIQMAENFLQRSPLTVDKTEVIPGTWLLGAYVRGSVKEQVLDGTLNIWSISAHAMAEFHEA